MTSKLAIITANFLDFRMISMKSVRLIYGLHLVLSLGTKNQSKIKKTSAKWV